jgi:hypothetical protein
MFDDTGGYISTKFSKSRLKIPQISHEITVFLLVKPLLFTMFDGYISYIPINPIVLLVKHGSTTTFSGFSRQVQIKIPLVVRRFLRIARFDDRSVTILEIS